jgi:hypothetical protein
MEVHACGNINTFQASRKDQAKDNQPQDHLALGGYNLQDSRFLKHILEDRWLYIAHRILAMFQAVQIWMNLMDHLYNDLYIDDIPDDNLCLVIDHL